jgi:hypothetical protein
VTLPTTAGTDDVVPPLGTILVRSSGRSTSAAIVMKVHGVPNIMGGNRMLVSHVKASGRLDAEAYGPECAVSPVLECSRYMQRTSLHRHRLWQNLELLPHPAAPWALPRSDGTLFLPRPVHRARGHLERDRDLPPAPALGAEPAHRLDIDLAAGSPDGLP